MQALRSNFLGTRPSVNFVAARPQTSTGARQPLTTCMAKKKGVRCIITLECTEARGLGATPSRYTTQKVSHSAWLYMMRGLRYLSSVLSWLCTARSHAVTLHHVCASCLPMLHQSQAQF